MTKFPMTVLVVGATGSYASDQHRLVLLQGDRRHAGDPSDGVIARRQIAQVLVHSLGSDEALRKSFELVAETGPTPDDFDALFASLDADPEGALDGVRDLENMRTQDEPQRVRDDLGAVLARRPSGANRRFFPGDPQGTGHESSIASTGDKRVTATRSREE